MSWLQNSILTPNPIKTSRKKDLVEYLDKFCSDWADLKAKMMSDDTILISTTFCNLITSSLGVLKHKTDGIHLDGKVTKKSDEEQSESSSSSSLSRESLIDLTQDKSPSSEEDRIQIPIGTFCRTMPYDKEPDKKKKKKETIVIENKKSGADFLSPEESSDQFELLKLLESRFGASTQRNEERNKMTDSDYQKTLSSMDHNQRFITFKFKRPTEPHVFATIPASPSFSLEPMEYQPNSFTGSFYQISAPLKNIMMSKDTCYHSTKQGVFTSENIFVGKKGDALHFPNGGVYVDAENKSLFTIVPGSTLFVDFDNGLIPLVLCEPAPSFPNPNFTRFF